MKATTGRSSSILRARQDDDEVSGERASFGNVNPEGVRRIIARAKKGTSMANMRFRLPVAQTRFTLDTIALCVIFAELKYRLAAMPMTGVLSKTTRALIILGVFAACG